MTRSINLHSEKSIRFTKHAEMYCRILNTMRRFEPTLSFEQMGKIVGLNPTAVRRYYYGVHDYNRYPVMYSQVRKGACVPI
jgi:hypothetical protein